MNLRDGTDKKCSRGQFKYWEIIQKCLRKSGEPDAEIKALGPCCGFLYQPKFPQRIKNIHVHREFLHTHKCARTHLHTVKYTHYM